MMDGKIRQQAHFVLAMRVSEITRLRWLVLLCMMMIISLRSTFYSLFIIIILFIHYVKSTWTASLPPAELTKSSHDVLS